MEQTPPQKKEETAPRQVMNTMRNDVNNAMIEQNETFVSIALAEESKKEKERKANIEAKKTLATNTASVPKPRGRMFILFILLVIAGILGAAYVYVLPMLGSIPFPKISFPSFQKSVNTPPVSPEFPITVEPPVLSVVPSQADKRFNTTSETPSHVASLIAAEMAKGSAVGAIKNLYFFEGDEYSPTDATASAFFAFENIQTPELISRSLEKQLMVGLMGDENSLVAPFIVLKISDHTSGIAGMLEWEAVLPNVLNTIFGTTISSGTNIRFYDASVGGKDARLLDDFSGTILTYAFATPNTIVITTSHTALEKLIPLAGKPSFR